MPSNNKKNYTISSGVNIFLDKAKPKGGWDKDRIYVAKLAGYFAITILVWNGLESFGLISDDNTTALFIFLGISSILALLMLIKIFKK